jgi:para-nitrobenzyl esterase
VLNVWTPGLNDGGKRAVLFSIHGGGYASGTGRNPVFDGRALARLGNVVVVTVNHRLGALGFCIWANSHSPAAGRRFAT